VGFSSFFSLTFLEQALQREKDTRERQREYKIAVVAIVVVVAIVAVWLVVH